MYVVLVYVLGVRMYVLGVCMFIMCGECNHSVAVCMFSKINFQPTMFVCFAFPCPWFFFVFRSVCRVRFECMLYKRMFLVCTCMFLVCACL